MPTTTFTNNAQWLGANTGTDAHWWYAEVTVPMTAAEIIRRQEEADRLMRATRLEGVWKPFPSDTTNENYGREDDV